MGCFYCEKNQPLNDLMIEISALQVSTLYLFREQTFTGRCVVAFNGHKTELFQLSKEELRLFMEDVALAAGAIQKAFNPDKINYAIFGDLVPHLHFHIVPKYKGGENWGVAFNTEPVPKKYLQPREYKVLVDQIKSKFGE